MAKLIGAPEGSASGEPLARKMSVDTDQSVWYAVSPPAQPWQLACQLASRVGTAAVGSRAGWTL